MVDAELLIGQLLSQVRNLQSLVHYLENRGVVEGEDYSYSAQRLRELIRQLKEMERFASQRSRMRALRAHWLN